MKCYLYVLQIYVPFTSLLLTRKVQTYKKKKKKDVENKINGNRSQKNIVKYCQKDIKKISKTDFKLAIL